MTRIQEIPRSDEDAPIDKFYDLLEILSDSVEEAYCSGEISWDAYRRRQELLGRWVETGKRLFINEFESNCEAG